MPKFNSYEPYPDFIIRTPLYPLDNIAFIPTEGDLTHFVADKWKSPIVRDAVLLASPDLYYQVKNGLKGNDINKKAIMAFIRYYLRMSYRCTPFGLFAGVGRGVISESTGIIPSEPYGYKLHCRLDMEYLGSIVSSLTADRNLRHSFSYSNNSSIYKLGASWRFIEVSYKNGPGKKYGIVAIESNPVLDSIIERSYEYRPWEQIRAQLINIGYGWNDSEDFINEMVDSQILVPDIYPSLTGVDFNKHLTEKLGNSASLRSRSDNFVELSNKVRSIKSPGSLSKAFTKVASLAKEAGEGFKLSHLVQADLNAVYHKSNIGSDISNSVLLGIRLLKSLAVKRNNTYLEEFRKHYQMRFGTREVPLPLVMDSEFGIGLTGPQGQQMADPAPLTDGLDFPMPNGPDASNKPHPLLMNKFKSFKPGTGNYLDIDKNDIASLSVNDGNWPDQLFAICRLTGSNRNNEILIDIASAGNPSRLIARFGHLSRDGIHGHIRQLVDDDIKNNPEFILADIVHLPENRAGNILQRPSYYDYEIPYLAAPGGDSEIIRPDQIKVSVVNERVILRHSKTGKRILTRLTNAHNYRSRQLPLYQFLVEIANQDEPDAFLPGWGWINNHYDFIPGLRYKNIVLSRPKWRMMVGKVLEAKSKDGGDHYKKILSWAEKNHLPAKSVWIQGENEMYIDWTSNTIVRAALDPIRQNRLAFFTDYPYNNGSPVVSDTGNYANEIIISFKKKIQ